MDNNYAIIRVTEKKLSLKSDFETAQSEYYKTKITELKNDYFAAYISEKRKKYEIRFNEDLYKQILERELGRFKN